MNMYKAPLGFIFNFGKIKFSHKIKPFFNSLNGKFQIVIEVWSRVCFWHGDACFHTQSVLFTLGPTFDMLRVIKLSHMAFFSKGATK